MKLLKTLIVRLSDSLFNNINLHLPRNRSQHLGKHLPSLKLVAHNPYPAVTESGAGYRSDVTVAGHAEAIDDALRKGEAWFFAHQDHEAGYWVEELEADTTLTSEYLMLRRFLNCVDPDRERKAVRYLLRTQLPDGGWPIYAGGPADISASVKAYFALKLAGIPAEAPELQRARETILQKGGVVSANVFTKIVLALFGQYDWRGIPSMPPELVLAPRWLYFNLYAVSYWSRAVIIPLLIIFAHRPLCPIAREQGIEELFVVPRDQIDYRAHPPFQRDAVWVSWRNFFVWVDRLLKLYECYPLQRLRRRALKVAERWMIDHMQGEGGLGAIYPAMANSAIALQALGYSSDHPLMTKALSEIEALEVHTTYHDGSGAPPTMHLQPCFSPVWDTALTVNMLVERGVPIDHPVLQHAAAWLRSRQCTQVGDWIVSAPHAKPGGWYFQFENEWYPDVDDTAAVVMALAKLHPTLPADDDEAIRRGCEWALALQGSDGGWGAYDKDNNRMIFNKIPFADHQALLDPSTADLTGRCLEMLGTLGYDRSHPAVEPALEFLRREQEPNGSWYGRWGVNYIYGTWCVLSGLRAIGVDMSAPWIQKAVTWLESIQNPDGGWGESCLSYEDPDVWAGKGESTASQTAWAIMGLLAAGVSDSINVLRGVNYLLKHQRENGVWDEPLHTGTGFPRVFYLRYHGYSKYFPLWALAMYRNIKMQGRSRADELRKAAQVARQKNST